MNKWSLQGFEAMSKGSFENAGQNIYVSKNGVLQRIWRFDVNNDGYVDLQITNSHDYNEHPDLYIFHDPTGEARRQEVLTQGAQTGAVADLNGNGYDDLFVNSIPKLYEAGITEEQINHILCDNPMKLLM